MKRLAFAMVTAGMLMACVAEKEPTRPNILFIMSDDHGYQSISAYSDHLMQTPNIDRIANEGMLFTNGCVTNALCAPSRAVLLTGKHNHLNGKIDNFSSFDTTNVVFPELLKANGYQTAMFGKLHFENIPNGFDQYKILPGQGHYYNPDFITKEEGTINVTGYVTDIITDFTLDWLKNEREEDKPFMLMYLHKAPHREWLPAPRHFKEFTKKTFPEPETLFDDYNGRGSAARESEMNILAHMNWAGDSKLTPEAMDELGIAETETFIKPWDKWAYEHTVGRMNEEQRAAWDSVYDPIIEDFKKRYPDMSEEDLMRWRYQRYMQDYLGSTAAVDEGVGRVLDYLEESGLAENTIVVYTSDQGFYLGEHGWFDKRFIYDESFKTPLMVRWPGKVKAGSVCNEMAQNLDFAQTFLDAAGVEAPADMQGESLVPLLTGNDQAWTREAVYYHFYEYPTVHMVKRHYGIVTKAFKLAHFYYDVDEWELYDRLEDPMEMNNVINDARYAGILVALKAQLKEMRENYEDSSELDQRFIQEYIRAGHDAR